MVNFPADNFLGPHDHALIEVCALEVMKQMSPLILRLTDKVDALAARVTAVVPASAATAVNSTDVATSLGVEALTPGSSSVSVSKSGHHRCGGAAAAKSSVRPTPYSRPRTTTVGSAGGSIGDIQQQANIIETEPSTRTTSWTSVRNSSHTQLDFHNRAVDSSHALSSNRLASAETTRTAQDKSTWADDAKMPVVSQNPPPSTSGTDVQSQETTFSVSNSKCLNEVVVQPHEALSMTSSNCTPTIPAGTASTRMHSNKHPVRAESDFLEIEDEDSSSGYAQTFSIPMGSALEPKRTAVGRDSYSGGIHDMLQSGASEKTNLSLSSQSEQSQNIDHSGLVLDEDFSLDGSPRAAGAKTSGLPTFTLNNNNSDALGPANMMDASSSATASDSTSGFTAVTVKTEPLSAMEEEAALMSCQDVISMYEQNHDEDPPQSSVSRAAQLPVIDRGASCSLIADSPPPPGYRKYTWRDLDVGTNEAAALLATQVNWRDVSLRISLQMPAPGADALNALNPSSNNPLAHFGASLYRAGMKKMPFIKLLLRHIFPPAYFVNRNATGRGPNGAADRFGPPKAAIDPDVLAGVLAVAHHFCARDDPGITDKLAAHKLNDWLRSDPLKAKLAVMLQNGNLIPTTSAAPLYTSSSAGY